MPLFGRNPEDAPISGDPAPDPAEKAELRTPRLTQELLDLCLYSLETLIRHPLVRMFAAQSTKDALTAAYKHVDRLHILTFLETTYEEPVEDVPVSPDGSPLASGLDEVG